MAVQKHIYTKGPELQGTQWELLNSCLERTGWASGQREGQSAPGRVGLRVGRTAPELVTVKLLSLIISSHRDRGLWSS